MRGTHLWCLPLRLQLLPEEREALQREVNDAALCQLFQVHLMTSRAKCRICSCAVCAQGSAGACAGYIRLGPRRCVGTVGC